MSQNESNYLNNSVSKLSSEGDSKSRCEFSLTGTPPISMGEPSQLSPTTRELPNLPRQKPSDTDGIGNGDSSVNPEDVTRGNHTQIRERFMIHHNRRHPIDLAKTMPERELLELIDTGMRYDNDSDSYILPRDTLLAAMADADQNQPLTPEEVLNHDQLLMDELMMDDEWGHDDDSDDSDEAEEKKAPPLFEKGQELTKECEICFEVKTVFLRLCCGFAVCDDCQDAYLKTSIEMARLTVQCLNSKCTAMVYSDEILARLPDDLTHRYYTFLIDANKNPGEKTCPRCSNVKKVTMEYISKFKTKKGLRVACSECYLVWCFVCHAPWHSGMKCKTYRKGDRLLKTWAKKRQRGLGYCVNAQRCPRCKVYIERNSGCDHMTCSNCGMDFCYLCGHKLTEIKLIGGHDSRFSILGCSKRLLPECAPARHLIRGTLFVGLMSVLMVGVALAPAATVIALPIAGVIKLKKLWRRRKRRREQRVYEKWLQNMSSIRYSTALTNLVPRGPYVEALPEDEVTTESGERRIRAQMALNHLQTPHQTILLRSRSLDSLSDFRSTNRTSNDLHPTEGVTDTVRPTVQFIRPSLEKENPCDETLGCLSISNETIEKCENGNSGDKSVSNLSQRKSFNGTSKYDSRDEHLSGYESMSTRRKSVSLVQVHHCDSDAEIGGENIGQPRSMSENCLKESAENDRENCDTEGDAIVKKSEKNYCTVRHKDVDGNGKFDGASCSKTDGVKFDLASSSKGVKFDVASLSKTDDSVTSDNDVEIKMPLQNNPVIKSDKDCVTEYDNSVESNKMIGIAAGGAKTKEYKRNNQPIPNGKRIEGNDVNMIKSKSCSDMIKIVRKPLRSIPDSRNIHSEKVREYCCTSKKYEIGDTSRFRASVKVDGGMKMDDELVLGNESIDFDKFDQSMGKMNRSNVVDSGIEFSENSGEVDKANGMKLVQNFEKFDNKFGHVLVRMGDMIKDKSVNITENPLLNMENVVSSTDEKITVNDKNDSVFVTRKSVGPGGDGGNVVTVTNVEKVLGEGGESDKLVINVTTCCVMLNDDAGLNSNC